MKKIIYILSIALCFNLHAATRYCVSGGTGNWNSTTNWSTTSGGASGASFPALGDIALFDANSPNLTVNTSIICDTLNCTGYTNTLTLNSTLTAITATFGSGMTISGTSTLFMAGGSGRLNTNGVTITGNLEIGEAPLTLISNVTVNGSISTAFNVSVTGTHTLNVGSNFTQGGDLTVTGGYTLTIIMTGASATWSSSNNRMGATLIYTNASGTFTLSGNCQLYQFGNLTTTAASVVTTGSTLTIISTTAFINTPNVTYNNCSIGGGGGIQLLINSSGVSFSGTVTLNTGGLVGAYGVTINNLTITNNGANQLGAGLTYIVNGALTSIGTSGLHGSLSSTSSTNAILTLTGTQNMRFCNGTHIDSSGGKQIHSVGAILSSTINWSNKQSNFNTFN